MTNAIAMARSTDQVRVPIYDFGGDGPDLLLCHANGFHGHIWQPVIETLRSRYRCLALDFRGHGASVVPDMLDYTWTGFGHDVVAVIDELELGLGLLVAGWSMGGCAAVLAEQSRPGLFAKIWTFEPIVFPPEAMDGREPGDDNSMSASARRRRAVFASRDAAFANYSSKPPFSMVDQRSLRAYVDFGLRDLADGTVRLCCEPDTEGDIFDQSISPAWAGLGTVQTPVTVVGSGDGAPPSIFAPSVAEALPNGVFEAMTDLTHFGPMQDPERIAASILAGVA